MPTLTTPTQHSGSKAVGRKKKSEKADDGGRPIGFRAPADLAADLDYVATHLGVDVSNLVRMILKENIHRYKERARRVEQGGGSEAGDA